MNGNGNGDPVKDQEILDYIKSQRDNGFSDDVIGMQLQMRGVADFDTYLKKRRYFDLALCFGRGRYGIRAEYRSSTTTRSWFFGCTFKSE